jgi:hypothetical protein
VTVSIVLISIPIFSSAASPAGFGAVGWFPVTATQGTTYQLIMPAFAGLGIAGLHRPADAGQPVREPARRLRPNGQQD